MAAVYPRRRRIESKLTPLAAGRGFNPFHF
jgi:hypothetical protein